MTTTAQEAGGRGQPLRFYVFFFEHGKHEHRVCVSRVRAEAEDFGPEVDDVEDKAELLARRIANAQIADCALA